VLVAPVLGELVLGEPVLVALVLGALVLEELVLEALVLEEPVLGALVLEEPVLGEPVLEEPVLGDNGGFQPVEQEPAALVQAVPTLGGPEPKMSNNCQQVFGGYMEVFLHLLERQAGYHHSILIGHHHSHIQNLHCSTHRPALVERPSPRRAAQRST